MILQLVSFFTQNFPFEIKHNILFDISFLICILYHPFNKLINIVLKRGVTLVNKLINIVLKKGVTLVLFNSFSVIYHKEEILKIIQSYVSIKDYYYHEW